MVGEWQDCKSTFSNGMEFELFVDQCLECTRYRNDHCRVLNACYKAMWDKSAFPYADLQDAPKGYGGKRCRHKTTEPIGRNKHSRKQIDGQLSFEL